MTRLIALLTVTLSLAACETIGGFGQDVEAAGQNISQTSNEVQEDI